MKDELDVKNKLIKIFNERLNFDFSDKRELFDENLFSSKVDLVAYELVYIFFDVEKTFNIKISEEDINNNRFMTFNSIKELILDYI